MGESGSVKSGIQVFFCFRYVMFHIMYLLTEMNSVYNVWLHLLLYSFYNCDVENVSEKLVEIQ